MDWYDRDSDGEVWGNVREMDSCAETYDFTVIWTGPGSNLNAEEWAAHIVPSRGATSVNYSFRRSPDT